MFSSTFSSTPQIFCQSYAAIFKLLQTEMPKKSSRRHKIVSGGGGGGEVTINDFADRTTQGSRTKKFLNKSIIDSKLAVSNNLIEDILSLDIKGQVDCDEDDDINVGAKRKRKNKQKMDPDHVYNDFHIDIWFLISEHVNPEDTGRFALICKKTEAVVCSARYWSNLYKRYYNSKFFLPERLKPDRMHRVGGLRARVICSLFYMCPTFSLRLSRPDRNNISRLEKMHCTEMWYRTVKEGIWMFCYRFSNRIRVRQPIASSQNLSNFSYGDRNEDEEDNDIFDRLEDFLAEHNNVFANRYEGQYLLVITTDRFIPLPELDVREDENGGIALDMIRQPLSKDLRQTGMELNFVNYSKTFLARSFYEKVLDFRTINWWDPEFWLFSDL